MDKDHPALPQPPIIVWARIEKQHNNRKPDSNLFWLRIKGFDCRKLSNEDDGHQEEQMASLHSAPYHHGPSLRVASDSGSQAVDWNQKVVTQI